jgi:hypothetical protein
MCHPRCATKFVQPQAEYPHLHTAKVKKVFVYKFLPVYKYLLH